MKKTKLVSAASGSKKVGVAEPWPEKYEEIVKELNTPAKIQEYIDKLPYDPSCETRSVWQTFELNTAHCFAGGLFAAYCLHRHGYGKPQILELRADYKVDEGHLLCVYKRDGLWGSIAKSNYNGIRGRDPVYRSVRELVMSYFEFYMNKDGVKSLRGHSDVIDLNKVDPKREWVLRKDIPSGADKVDRIAAKCPNNILPKGFKCKKDLAQMKGKTLKAQLLGSNPKGLFKTN